MANETYVKGWEGARLAIYRDDAYMPIACITSRDETHATESTEKTNVCTEGRTIRKQNAITRTMSIAGEVVTADSYDELMAAQNELINHTFRIYRGAGTTDPVYFVAEISNLASSYDAATEGADATFTMDLAIEGDFLETDPNNLP